MGSQDPARLDGTVGDEGSLVGPPHELAAVVEPGEALMPLRHSNTPKIEAHSIPQP